MARLCEKCHTCHPIGTKCIKLKSLKQIAKEVSENTRRILRAMNRAEQETREHPSEDKYAGVIRIKDKYEGMIKSTTQ